MADSLAIRPFKTRPSAVATVKLAYLRFERPVGVEDRDQERLGRLVGQRGQVGPDLDPFVAQAVARGTDFLKTAAPAAGSPWRAQGRAIGVDDRLPGLGLRGRRRPRRAARSPASRRSSSRWRRAGSISAGRHAAVLERREQRRRPGSGGSGARRGSRRGPAGEWLFQSASSMSATLRIGRSVPRAATAACWSATGDLRPQAARSAGRDRRWFARRGVAQQPDAPRAGRRRRPSRPRPASRAACPEPANGLSRSRASGVLARSRASSKPAARRTARGHSDPPAPPAGRSIADQRIEHLPPGIEPASRPSSGSTIAGGGGVAVVARHQRRPGAARDVRDRRAQDGGPHPGVVRRRAGPAARGPAPARRSSQSPSSERDLEPDLRGRDRRPAAARRPATRGRAAESGSHGRDRRSRGPRGCAIGRDRPGPIGSSRPPRSASVQIACTRVLGRFVLPRPARGAARSRPGRRGAAAAAGPCRAASRWGCRARRPAPAVSSLSSRGIGRGFLSTGIDAVDPPLLAAGAEVEPLLPVVGDPLGVLDDGAVHVGDPECAVGAGLEHRRPEPVVAGGEELAVRLVRPATAAEAHAVGLEHHPVDQVVHRLADEQAGGEPRAEEVVAVGRRAVGRGDVVGRAEVVEPGERPADRDRRRVSGSSVCRGSGGA